MKTLTFLLKSLIFAGSIAGIVNLWPAQAETTLRVGTTTMPPSIGNPYRNTGTPHIFTWSAIFDGLTRIDRAGIVQPWLAVSWKNVDTRTWRISLRPGVTFSNGEPLTAEAVVNVLDIFRSPDSVRDAVAREFRFLETARIVDDLTVELVTNSPTPHLPRALPLMYMVPPKYWRSVGPEEFARKPVATGPFKLDKPDINGWKMSAFAGSWRKPRVDKLEWIVAPDASARVQAILADRVDIALGLGPDEISILADSGAKGETWRTASVWAINFHHRKDTPLHDRRVREAINIAVDRDALVRGLLNNVTVSASQPSPVGVFGFDPAIPPIPYDPDRAKKLLAEAGFPSGFKFVVEAVLGAGPADAAMYQKIAQDLAKIGVQMEIRSFPPNELIRAVMEGSWKGDAFGLTYATEPTVDALRPMQNHSCLWARPWYCDERIMPTINAAFKEFDEVKGLEMRREVMRFYRQEFVSLFLYELPRFAGLRANISNFQEVHGFINFDSILISQ